MASPIGKKPFRREKKEEKGGGGIKKRRAGKRIISMFLKYTPKKARNVKTAERGERAMPYARESLRPYLRVHA